MLITDISKFSEVETAVGAQHAKSKFHFPIDKKTLRERANLALQKKHQYPNFPLPEILKDVLSDIHFSERRAYSSAICKMFSDRSPQHHKVSA